MSAAVGADRAGATPARARHAVLATAGRFLRRSWLGVAGCSAVLLIPCFWQRRIQAGDLASHVYNAWLTQLIAQGQAPGLWLAPQWQNVLFDVVLGNLIARFGFGLGERLAVALAVLVFFWGAFAFIAVATGRAPWLLLPGLAMVSYGWTFHAGFFNYYLAVGLSFFALALTWRGSAVDRTAAGILVPVIVVAHPLGLLWLMAALACIALAERLPRRYGALLPLGAAVLLFAIATYLRAHHTVMPAFWPLPLINGTDQLYLFGGRYHLVVIATLLFGATALVAEGVARWRGQTPWESVLPVPLYVLAQLYALVQLGVLLLPSVVLSPLFPAPVGLLVERLSLVSAVLACAILGTLRPRRWHAVALGAIAAVFFAWVYRDADVLNGMEDDLERRLAALPPHQRVLATLRAAPDSRMWFSHHMVARACIGRCFAYGNYEPSSGQFRVRVRPGSPVALASASDVLAAQAGTYVVKPGDLPVYQVHRCGAGTDLCLRPLAAGERNSPP